MYIIPLLFDSLLLGKLYTKFGNTKVNQAGSGSTKYRTTNNTAQTTKLVQKAM